MATIFDKQPSGWHIWQDTHDRGEYHVCRPDGRVVDDTATDSIDEARETMRRLMAEEMAKESVE